jgi:hypothetical protein
MDKVYSKNPDVVFRKIADEFILVPIRQKVVDLKSVYTLNETGAFIWEQIDGSTPASGIRDRLAAEFEVEASQAETDVSGLLSQLETLTFIRPA